MLLTSSTLKKQHDKRNKKNKNKNNNHDHPKRSYEQCIGQTPLIHLQKLSSKINHHIRTSTNNGEYICKGKQQQKNNNKKVINTKNIYVKMECLNPGGTGKDRAALYMLRRAEENGDLPMPLPHFTYDGDGSSIDFVSSSNNDENECCTNANVNVNNNTMDISTTIQTAIAKSKTGGIVVEGTSGSTGISLATLCTQRGHSIVVVMPDDQAVEKRQILKCLGAVVHVVPNVSISNPNHYVNVAKKIAEEVNNCNNNKGSGLYCGRVVKAAFMNQFENEANYNAHVSTTGPEIFEQMNGDIDAFCMSAGTGGTYVFNIFLQLLIIL